jgi:four helix bundle protein
MNQQQLEERLIEFSANILKIVQSLPKNKIANELGEQLIRSGTSVTLNYSEARAGESKKDFLHKIKVVLKELRECHSNVRLIRKSISLEDTSLLDQTIDENDQLIAIFVTSSKTAQKNIEKG